MKRLLPVLLACASLVAADTQSPFDKSDLRYLTEAEIRTLKADVTFEEIEKRLRYFTRAAVAIPMITFPIDESEGDECIMYFQDKTGKLIYAARYRRGTSSQVDPEVLWPAQMSGKKLSEVIANKAVDPTPGTAPRNSAGSGEG